MPISTTQTIEDKGTTWVITGTVKLPMGETVDVVTVDKTTLALRKRSLKAGPAAFDLSFEGGKAVGTVTMGGDPKPVSVDLGGELFADGAGGREAIGALPLAEGYSVTFRNFDLRQQKVQIKQARVVGVEEVTVPAGTAKAWKVEITSVEGEGERTTVWIAPATRQVLKTQATLPQMAGAVVTSELLP
jgi:hypothetical protein